MTNPLNFLPSLGMTGFYSLAAPYDKLISPSAQYSCEGVKSLASAGAEGQDPLNKVYLANGDTKANYERDLAAGVSLVTIRSEGGSLIVFPHTAMLKVPLANGVVYRNTVLAIPLGAVADLQDLTLLQSEIVQLIEQEFGLKSAAYITTVGAPCILTSTQHDSIKAARTARITQNESGIALNARLTRELAAAVAKIAELEAYLLTHH